MPTPKQDRQYLVYARKSTDDADNQKNSIDYQVNEGLKLAKNNNLHVADFTLAGFSKNGIIQERHTAFKTSDIVIKKDGSVQYKIERPKFKKLVSLLLTRQFAGVICLCWDRASRNDKDEMVIKQLIENDVDVRFVQTTYDDSSSGALHMDIDGMFAKHYSRVVSEKVRAAYDKLRSEGKCIYMAPIGYLDKGVDNKPFDPERAPLVKRIFELYSSGNWSLNQLAVWANKNGLTTKPLRKKRTREEILVDEDGLEKRPKVPRPVSRKTIELILNNPFYIGKLKHQDEIADGIHQPLISVSLFNKVQEVLKSKSYTVHYIDKKFYTYRRLIRCACGRLYSPYIKKGITYYTSKCHADCGNEQKNLRETDIDSEIKNLLGQIHFSQEELKKIEAKAKTELNIIHKQRDKDLDDLHAQQKRVYADLNYLEQNKITLLRTSTLTPEAYTQDTAKLQKELEVIQEKMGVYKETEQEMLNYILIFSELVKRAKIYYKSALDSEKQELATKVFSELSFYNGNLANFTAKEGYEALLKRASVSSGGPDYLFSELINIYTSVRLSMVELKKLSCFKNPH